ncbi:hypothetical protein CGLO_10407 [Colletotrichum gloeosporioides Cg-14]|nr:hypothetical protein CGLO_10407 [Colletotrichum gloeosporioides Cg-14]
MKAEKDR